MGRAATSPGPEADPALPAVGYVTIMTKPASLDPDPNAKRSRAMSRFQVVEAPTKPRVVQTRRTIGCKIWIVILVVGGTALLTYGSAYEHQWEFKKLYISVGILLYMCVALFFSFVVFDRKELQQYMLYMLYPWMCLSCLLLAALVFAMAERFISVYYFVTMLIPILAIGFYTFGEIFLYLERQRLRPLLLHQHIQERASLRQKMNRTNRLVLATPAKRIYLAEVTNTKASRQQNKTVLNISNVAAI